MKELAKVPRVIEGHLAGAPHGTLLVVDATTGLDDLRPFDPHDFARALVAG